MTSVDKNGNATTATANLGFSGGSTPVQPVLQRADGTYVGTVGQSMVAFTLSGQAGLLQRSNNELGFVPIGGAGLSAVELPAERAATA
jgi:hypothetical protein